MMKTNHLVLLLLACLFAQIVVNFSADVESTNTNKKEGCKAEDSAAARNPWAVAKSMSGGIMKAATIALAASSSLTTALGARPQGVEWNNNANPNLPATFNSLPSHTLHRHPAHFGAQNNFEQFHPAVPPPPPRSQQHQKRKLLADDDAKCSKKCAETGSKACVRECQREARRLESVECTSCSTNDCCADGWSRFGNNCYKVVADPNTEYTYDDAYNTCKGLGDGADLVSIHSQGEQDFVTNLVITAAKNNGNLTEIIGRSYFWTGLCLTWDTIKYKVSGASWSDKSPVDYGNPIDSPWGSPDDKNGVDGDQESCTMMYGEDKYWAGDWEDVRCNNSQAYYNVHGMVCQQRDKCTS